MALTPGERVGPYEVLALVGAGGMGEVYRARDSRLGRDVALKLLPARFSGDASRFDRFEREARATAQINHPNILSVYDVGQHNGCPYLVSEMLEGRTLAALQGGLPLPARKAIALATQIASGLAAAHDKGIVHRDLKPSNLLVTSDGRLKILDFGLAKLTLPAEGMLRPGAHTRTHTTETNSGTTVGTVGYMSPEQVRGREVDLRSDIFSLGAVLYEMLCGRRAFSGDTSAEVLAAILTSDPPELSRGDCVPPALERIVRRCLEKDPENRFHSTHDLALALESVLDRPTSGAESQDEGAEWSPYPGLRCFTEADAGRFFGREGEAAALWEKIRRRSLLAVTGPSGVGKTSFVLAGVVAARPAGWAAVVCNPGPAPLAALARALAPEVAGDADALRQLIGYEDPDVLMEVMGRWRTAHTAALLVVDQFEELFTLNPPVTQQRFAALLGRLAGQAHVHVLISLRDDFLMRCRDHEALVTIFADLTPLGPLSGEALRRALVVPAENEGFRFEDEALVPEMVAAVAGERGALPLLAFAVARLWDKRDRGKRVLTRRAYDEIGGVAGSLAQHAEETLQRIGSERQAMVRELFRNLVTSEGTRAACERQELLSVLPEGQTREDVLRELIDARLLTSYEVESVEAGQERTQHRVEVVHESLLTAWPRLVLWRAQDQEGALLRDQIRQAAQLWEEKHRPPDLLWTGTSYHEFQLWHERYPGGLTVREESFARAMVERARRRKRLLRAAVAAAFVLLAGVAGVIAVSRQQAVASQRRSLAGRLLTLAQLRITADPTEALAYDIASLEVADSPEARVFAARVLAEAPPAIELVPDDPSSQPRTLAFSPDGRYLASAGHTEVVTVWSDDGRQVARLRGHVTSPRGPNYPAWASPSRLVTGGVSPLLYLWSIPEGQRLRTIDRRSTAGIDDSRWELGLWFIEPDRVVELVEEEGATGSFARLRSLSLVDGHAESLARLEWTTLAAKRWAPLLVRASPPGWLAPLRQGWIYAKGRDLVMRPLPAADGARDRVIGHHDAEIEQLGGLRGHPERIWSLDKAGVIRIWSFSGRGAELVGELHKPRTASDAMIALAPDGRVVHNVLKLGWAERSLRLWDTAAPDGAEPMVLRRTGSWHGARADFHPGGHWVAISTAGNARVTFWPLGQAFPSVIPGYTGLTRPVAFSPDGRWLATAWSDRRLRLWPMPGTGARELKALGLPETEWVALSFDPRGRYLFAVGSRDHAWIVPLDGSPPRRLPAYSSDMLLFAAAISPSGRLVATAHLYGKGDKTLRVHDVQDNTTRTFPLPGFDSGDTPTSSPATGWEKGICSLSFADENTLFSGGEGGVRRWSLPTGSQRVVWPAGPGFQVCAALRGDGSRTALVRESKLGGSGCGPLRLVDLTTGRPEPLPALGECPMGDLSSALDASGNVAVVGNNDGTVRVGRLDGATPHVFVGHEGTVDAVAISPDLRWLASTGEDNTLRLWPIPDLSKPPLYAQPRSALLAKLKSLTNLRAVPTAGSPDNWTIEVGSFPGWKEVPTP